MEPVVFMPTALAGHMAKHCNHVVSSPDENNNTGGVYKGAPTCQWKKFVNMLSVGQPKNG